MLRSYGIEQPAVYGDAGQFEMRITFSRRGIFCRRSHIFEEDRLEVLHG